MNREYTGLEQVIRRAAAQADARAVPQAEDYIGPSGLLTCGSCGTPKQCRVTIAGRERVVGCLCRCGTQRRDERQRQMQEAQRQMQAQRRKRAAMGSSVLREADFRSARPTELIEKAKNYVENWDLARENNVGLLLMGGVGVGKSYAAACICNALLDRGVFCHMTSFGRILAMEWEERSRLISSLGRYELLVLDDLGSERATEYANEVIFSVVDERCRAGKPLVVTTNLGLPELRNPPDLARARIYDRLLEICGPVLAEAESLRRSGANATRQSLRRVLGKE